LDLEISVGALHLRAKLQSRSAALALVGPSGAGKSTLLRVLAGLERRARGKLVVGGECWQDSGPGVFLPAWRRRAAWVPQDSCLFPHLSVRRNLAYTGADDATVLAAAQRLELAGLLDRMPRNLSGGERQRVALGRAMLASPRLLLLDEPFAALDTPLRLRLGPVLAGWCEDLAVPRVLVSHDARDLESLADEVWRIEGGVLVRA
jgi:molybdate transport system ATP-binding protein